MQRTMPLSLESSLDSPSIFPSSEIAVALPLEFPSSIARWRAKTSGRTLFLMATSAIKALNLVGGAVMLSRSLTSQPIARATNPRRSTLDTGSARARRRFCRFSVQIRLAIWRKATVRFPSPGSSAWLVDVKWFTRPTPRRVTVAIAATASIQSNAPRAMGRRLSIACLTRDPLPGIKRRLSAVISPGAPAPAVLRRG